METESIIDRLLSLLSPQSADTSERGSGWIIAISLMALVLSIVVVLYYRWGKKPALAALLASAFGILALIGCYLWFVPGGRAPVEPLFSRVTPGMKASEVATLLGPPGSKHSITQDRENYGGPPSGKPVGWNDLRIGQTVEYWHYQGSDGQGWVLVDVESQAVIFAWFWKGQEIPGG